MSISRDIKNRCHSNIIKQHGNRARGHKFFLTGNISRDVNNLYHWLMNVSG